MERLEYDLRYARDGYSVEAAIRKGRELPDWAKDEPILEFPMNFYLESFWELHSERLYEMGPIPRSKVSDYAKELEFDFILKEAFIQILARLDNHFIRLSIEQRKKEFERNKPIVPNKRSK